MEAPKEIEPVVKVEVKRGSTVSVPLKAVGGGEQTIATLTELANKENNLNMQILIENLTTIERNLSRNVETTPAESAKHMQSLYRTILQTINADKPLRQFRQEWEFILQFFKEKEKGGLGGARLYRGVAFWSLGHDEYVLYQSFMNLIEATNRWGATGCKPYVDMNRVVKHPVSEAGRGRLLSFYA